MIKNTENFNEIMIELVFAGMWKKVCNEEEPLIGNIPSKMIARQ